MTARRFALAMGSVTQAAGPSVAGTTAEATGTFVPAFLAAAVVAGASMLVKRTH